MTTEQIKDYLIKYRIDSEEQLVKHIEELKRNTVPNNEIIFPLVDMLFNEKSVLDSFFGGKISYKITPDNFNIDKPTNFNTTNLVNMYGGEILNYKKCSPQCFCDGSCKKPQSILTNHISSVIDKDNMRLAEYAKSLLDSNCNKTDIEKYGVKDNQKEPKAPIFTFCKQMKNAIEALAFRSLYGHERYKEFDEDWQNFSRVPNGDFEYSNAEFRHALEIGEDEDEDEEQHLVASAWNSIARLEIYLKTKKLNKS